NEANGPLWARTVMGGLRDDAGRLEDDAGTGAVIGRALAQVPRVKVGAADDVFVRLFAPAHFADRVVAGDRAGDEFVGDVDDRPRLGVGPVREPPEQGVMVVGDE